MVDRKVGMFCQVQKVFDKTKAAWYSIFRSWQGNWPEQGEKTMAKTREQILEAIEQQEEKNQKRA